VRTHETAEAADRAGISVDELRRLVELGIVRPDVDGRYRPGDVRRAGLVASFLAAGIALDDLGRAIRNGQVSLDFLDAPAFERLSAFSDVTFGELAERSGTPVRLMLQIRDAAGSPAVGPDDRVREEELAFASMIELAFKAGFHESSLQRMMRVQGDSLRRVAETEASMWQTEVIGPAVAAGRRPDEVLGIDFGDRMSALTEQSVIGMYHLQQTLAWGRNIIEGLESQLAEAGVHSRLDRPPAMCFLDITGYTRLTEERGDTAAADLADQFSGLVQRISVKHGGRPVKWLGDGVMLHFPNPGPGVVAALEMGVGMAEAGLPTAHVGMHAGPVIFQDGDYYGRTVNVAARIAEYARPSEVIVSQDVVDASAGAEVAFREIGPVELKGVAGAVHLHAASRPG
jgi:adenylate cyclase